MAFNNLFQQVFQDLEATKIRFRIPEAAPELQAHKHRRLGLLPGLAEQDLVGASSKDFFQDDDPADIRSAKGRGTTKFFMAPLSSRWDDTMS